MHISPIFAIDGYKLGHRAQYPEGTEFVYGNFTPRSAKHFKSPVFQRTEAPLIWVGTQAFVKQWLVDGFNEDFFQQPKDVIVPKFKKAVDKYLGGDVVPADGVAALHDLGYLPLKIKSVPEGYLVHMKLPVLTVQNTLPDFYWLVNYLETLISCELWPVATAATIAFNYRILCEYGAARTCDNLDHIQWQCHDFAARGNMGMWANSLTGLGHLTAFTGTDSFFALERVIEQYKVNEEYLYGMGVNATEHSVMCMGKKSDELKTFERLITEVYPTGILSIVSDTWDYWQVLTDFVPRLSDVINERDGKVVFRPDSGNPADIICGFPYHKLNTTSTIQKQLETLSAKLNDYFYYQSTMYKINMVTGQDGVYCYEQVESAPVKGSIELLWETFGGHVNEKGFKVLNPKVGLIYGDSITLDVCKDVFERLEAKGFATSNVVLGIGSFTYQYVTRDTFGFAMKATYGVVKGEGRAIQKSPKTDDGTKKSLKGLIHHKFKFGEWIATDSVTPEREEESDLPVIFHNGVVLNEVNLEQVRTRVSKYVGNVVKACLAQ